MLRFLNGKLPFWTMLSVLLEMFMKTVFFHYTAQDMHKQGPASGEYILV